MTTTGLEEEEEYGFRFLYFPFSLFVCFFFVVVCFIIFLLFIIVFFRLVSFSNMRVCVCFAYDQLKRKKVEFEYEKKTKNTGVHISINKKEFGSVLSASDFTVFPLHPFPSHLIHMVRLNV